MPCFNSCMPLSHYSPTFHTLLNEARERYVTPGETIVTTEDIHSVFCVKQGFVKRFLIKNDGSISVQGIYGPGDCFGMTALSRLLIANATFGSTEVYYYEAINKALICEIDDYVVQQALTTHPELYKDFFTIQGWQNIGDVWQLENRGLENATKRVAHIITHYMERYGRNTKQGWEFKVPFIQQDLADILDLTRETVSLAIGDLKKLQLLSDQRHIIVPDITALKDYAYS